MALVLAEFYYHQNLLGRLLKPFLPFGFEQQGAHVVVEIPADFSPRGDKVFIRPKAVELLGLLESGAIDYAVEYVSVARQHHLGYVTLPPEINLGSTTYKAHYARVRVLLANGKQVVGKPIVYGIAALKIAPHPKAAKLFEQFVLSPEGARILRENFQTPIFPAQLIRTKAN